MAKNKKKQSVKYVENKKIHKGPRFLLVLVAFIFVILTILGIRHFQENRIAKLNATKYAASVSWVATWTQAPVDMGNHNFVGTVRNILYPEAGGDTVRIKFTNLFGNAPLTLEDAQIGEVDSKGEIIGSETPLTVGGKTSFTIAQGKEVYSDSTNYKVSAGKRLAVTFYVPKPIEQTGHSIANETSFITLGTNQTKNLSSVNWIPTTSWWFIDGVDVKPSSKLNGTVVAFGDSITDGFMSSMNKEQRYPNYLSERLKQSLSVVNAGITGNALLKDDKIINISKGAPLGYSGELRFKHDVIDVAGVKYVIVLIGVNDIGGNNAKAGKIIAGYKKLISQAHEAGIKIYGGTITPFRDSANWSSQKEKTREAINKWVLTSGEFDGTIDFASALASPNNSQQMNNAYDSGDHLHPNDRGYQIMGNAANLNLFK